VVTFVEEELRFGAELVHSWTKPEVISPILWKGVLADDKRHNGRARAVTENVSLPTQQSLRVFKAARVYMRCRWFPLKIMGASSADSFASFIWIHGVFGCGGTSWRKKGTGTSRTCVVEIDHRV
jgi:hypothetical protein